MHGKNRIEGRTKSEIHVQANEGNVALIAQLLRLGSHINRVGIASLKNEVLRDLEISSKREFDDIFVEIRIRILFVKLIIEVVLVI